MQELMLWSTITCPTIQKSQLHHLESAHSEVVRHVTYHPPPISNLKAFENRKWKPQVNQILPSSMGRVAPDPKASKQQNARRNRKTTSCRCISIFGLERCICHLMYDNLICPSFPLYNLLALVQILNFNFFYLVCE